MVEGAWRVHTVDLKVLWKKIREKERMMKMAEIKYDIIKQLGNIGEGSKGWKKEVNVVSWNNRKPKIDIRDWDENHHKMGKGITLGKEEIKALKEILDGIDLDSLGLD